MIGDEDAQGAHLRNDLRELAAAPWEEHLLATAEFQHAVHVWSLAKGTPTAAFATVFDWGGRRLALVDGDDPVVVAGAWARHSICGYDLSGQRLWQDTSRSAVQVLTALSDGRVAVSYNRGPTRVLQAASGQQLRSLHGVRQVFALTPDASLGMGSTWCRLLDRSLDPSGPRIAVPSALLVSAATDGVHLALAEVGGPLRIVNLDGRERASIAWHARHVAHDPVTATWVALQESADGRTSLLRLDDDAQVLDQRTCAPVRDVATVRAGKELLLLTKEGLQVVDCADWSTRTWPEA